MGRHRQTGHPPHQPDAQFKITKIQGEPHTRPIDPLHKTRMRQAVLFTHEQAHFATGIAGQILGRKFRKKFYSDAIHLGKHILA